MTYGYITIDCILRKGFLSYFDGDINESYIPGSRAEEPGPPKSRAGSEKR